MKGFKIAVCQVMVHPQKEKNLKNAEKTIDAAAKNKVDLIIFPEMFNTPYDSEIFYENAEKFPGETANLLSALADKYSVYIIGGSIPEKDKNHTFNTSFVFDRNGALIAKHRKIHLFDVDIKGGQKFRESDSIYPGDRVTVFDTEYCRVGLCICYDIRFPELFIKMTELDVKLIVIPAAFNMTTGPAHWKLLTRARALDCQSFLAAAAPARNESLNYISYGHSLITDPWGKIIASAGFREKIIYKKIDLDLVDSIRKQLPVLHHKRRDIY